MKTIVNLLLYKHLGNSVRKVGKVDNEADISPGANSLETDVELFIDRHLFLSSSQTPSTILLGPHFSDFLFSKPLLDFCLRHSLFDVDRATEIDQAETRRQQTPLPRVTSERSGLHDDVTYVRRLVKVPLRMKTEVQRMAFGPSLHINITMPLSRGKNGRSLLFIGQLIGVNWCSALFHQQNGAQCVSVFTGRQIISIELRNEWTNRNGP